MSNHPGEERLALYFRDDLRENECRTVKEHVQACSVCQLTLSEFRRNQELLERFSDEPTPEQLSEVREAVLSRLAGRKNRWPAALAVLAAAAAAALFAVLHIPRAPVTYLNPAVAVRHLAAQNTGPSLPRVVQARRKIHHRAAPGLRSVDLIATEDDAPVIKMTTADPNVVILLQTERTVNYE